MPTTIADLWLLTYEGYRVDIRSPLFTSRQIEREVQRANWERRRGRTDWTAIDLEEVILEYVASSGNAACSCAETPQRRQLLN